MDRVSLIPMCTFRAPTIAFHYGLQLCQGISDNPEFFFEDDLWEISLQYLYLIPNIRTFKVNYFIFQWISLFLDTLSIDTFFLSRSTYVSVVFIWFSVDQSLRRSIPSRRCGYLKKNMRTMVWRQFTGRHFKFSPRRQDYFIFLVCAGFAILAPRCHHNRCNGVHCCSYKSM